VRRLKVYGRLANVKYMNFNFTCGGLIFYISARFGFQSVSAKVELVYIIILTIVVLRHECHLIISIINSDLINFYLHSIPTENLVVSILK